METAQPATLRSGRARGQSAYRPVYADMAETAAAEMGATDAQLAQLFGVTRRAVEKWKKAHPEFCEALRRGKEAADARVTRSLFQRAVGFSYEERKVVTGADGGQIVTVYNRVALPDVVAAIKWLFNREPSKWRASPVEADDDTPEPKQITIVAKDCRLPTSEPDTTPPNAI